MHNTHAKAITGRVLALLFALALLLYPMSEMLSVPVTAKQQTYTAGTAAAVPGDISGDALPDEPITEPTTDPSVPEEDVPYTALSEEAKKAMADENLPAAGYEEDTSLTENAIPADEAARQLFILLTQLEERGATSFGGHTVSEMRSALQAASRSAVTALPDTGKSVPSTDTDTSTEETTAESSLTLQAKATTTEGSSAADTKAATKALTTAAPTLKAKTPTKGLTTQSTTQNTTGDSTVIPQKKDDKLTVRGEGVDADLSTLSPEDWERLVTQGHNTDDPIHNFDATYSTDMLEDGDTVYRIERGHNFGIKYTVTLSTGEEIDVGNAVIRLPSKLFEDRNGQPVTIRDKDGIALPLYQVEPTSTDGGLPLYTVEPGSVVKSNRTSFGYFIETDDNGDETYVIVNYETVKAGTSWFEVVYDEINVFDVPDGVKDGQVTEETQDTWSVQPTMDVQYKYKTNRWVYIGNALKQPMETRTLMPIGFNWQEYLCEDSGNSYLVFSNNSGSEIYYAKEPSDYQAENAFMQYYRKNEDGTSTLRYRLTYDTLRYEELVDGAWIPIADGDAPTMAIEIATLCEKNGRTYYAVDTYDEPNDRMVTTYYDENGQPVYQERPSGTTTTYYKIVTDPTTHEQQWEEDAHVKQWIPSPQWTTEQFHEESHQPMTGMIDTKAELTTVSKKAGAVTANVAGDLNSVSQVLSFLPQKQQSTAAIDLENNVYVLWEIDIAGQNCTQPFSLYLDECLSYHNRQLQYGDGQALTYTYYDIATGTLITTSDTTDERRYDGQIIGIVGDSVTQIDGGEPYTTPYGVNSDGLWFIGSSDPAYSGDAHNDGLTRVRETGQYNKKVYVVASYPRGQFPAGGIVSDQQDGVCIDTLTPTADGQWVYVPHGAYMAGHRRHDLDPLFQAKLGAAYDSTKGNLVPRSVAKEVLQSILDEELSASSSVSTISPLMQDFVDELTINLPQTDELHTILASMTPEQVKAYILSSWQDPQDDRQRQQIKKACDSYLSTVLDEQLEKLRVTAADGTAISLNSYDKQTLYREVSNDVHVLLQPADNIDSRQDRTASAEHHRVDKEPNVPNNFRVSKKAQGGKKGWIDMYDASADDLFRSTFRFEVTSTGISFNETHPKDYAYFYDNQSYVHLVTADDLLTAEPTGLCADGSTLYGGSCLLEPEDYGYTYAKIIVNEQVYHVVDDTSSYGATPLSDEALLNRADCPADRDWYIYVSYGTDSNGQTVWEPEPYYVIHMEDYLNESPSDYTRDTAGANVVGLDFTADDRLPFRIKVEHNTIDYLSTVKLQLTAAIKRDAPHLSVPDDGHPNSLRTAVYAGSDASYTAFSGDDERVDIFKLRLHNYAAFHAQKYTLSTDDSDRLIITPDAVLTSSKLTAYDLMNADKVNTNPHIAPDDTLTDEPYVTAEPIGLSGREGEVQRSTDYVDLSRLEKAAYSVKTSDFTNDLTHGRAHLTYRIAGFEGYQLDSTYKEDLDILSGSDHYRLPGQDRQHIYIYDLLPPGVEFEGYSGSNQKPIAGFLRRSSDLTDESSWLTTDDSGDPLIEVSVEVVGENDPAWSSWGGVQSGRYLVCFTLTLPENAGQYALAEGGHWFFGCGVRFSANVSWERYTIAKNTPNLSVYVTDTETIGKYRSQTCPDDGTYVPYRNEQDLTDIYRPFRNTDNDPHKQNLDRNPATDIQTYNRMYASSMALGDIARSSSNAIGKQVRSDADIFALYSEKTAVVKGEGYTYNINVENQSGGAVSGIILYDVIENVDANSDVSWQGTLRGMDTSFLSLLGIHPKVYYHTALNEQGSPVTPSVPKTTSVDPLAAPALPTEADWTALGWQPADRWQSDLSAVKAVAIALYEADGITPYVLSGRETLSYQLLMKAPTRLSSENRRYARNISHYCYYKVKNNEAGQWVTDDNDTYYYDEAGNRTSVTIGERRMLKIAKRVDEKYSDMLAINDNSFTFRLTRYMGFYEDNQFVEADVPCANIQYKVYRCTFDDRGYINELLEEVSPGTIYTTDENGDLVLHDGECAVFAYLPTTTVPADKADKYDFDNYKVTEQSKPFWYELKTVSDPSTDYWYEGDDPANAHTASPQPSEPYDGVHVYYKKKDVTITNTYRPVIYVSKNVSGVPADCPTDPLEPNADGTMTRQEAFNTFDYLLELYEYPIDRLTGDYFGNDAAYSTSADTDGDGQMTLSDGTIVKAAWRKFKDYYDNLPSVLTKLSEQLAALDTAIQALDPETQASELEEMMREHQSCMELKSSIEQDKTLFDTHITHYAGQNAAEGYAHFFSPPRVEDENDHWVGNGYLLWTVSNRLIMPISGFAETPLDGTYKSFSNRISEQDDRRNGAYMYRYTVDSQTDIYSSPDGWVFWETNDQQNRQEIAAVNNPIQVKVRAGEIVALPLYLDGGMLYSDYGVTQDDEGGITFRGTPSYTARYCYRFTEDMDNKYWNDQAGAYRSVPQDADGRYHEEERSWDVQLPAHNKPFRNTLGAMGENMTNYDNVYRFKDIYLQKSVAPSESIPTGDAANSVDKTVFIYRLTRKAADAPAGAVPTTIPANLCQRMTWELWRRDSTGKLTDKLMTAPVTDDGRIIAPFANYNGASTYYTVKIRYVETGYIYYLQEELDPNAVNGFPYITYDAATHTVQYRYDTHDTTYSGAADRVYFYADSGLDPAQLYTPASRLLYAATNTETSGAIKISDSELIRDSMSKADMTVDNVYKLRSLTITKSIIARTIDNERYFTVRLRRQDGTAFAPTEVRFYRLNGSRRTYLSQEEVNRLQGVTEGDYTPTLTTVTDSSVPQPFACLTLRLQNGIYAELVDIGNEFDVFALQEQDWGEECSYIHLDPADAPGDWSAWKYIPLGDHTVATVRNGDEGYMIISKDYVSDGSGDYDEYASGYLSGDSHPVELCFALRAKELGTAYTVPTQLPPTLAFVDGAAVTDLGHITLGGGQSVVIDLKNLCAYLNLPYEQVEYQITESIPEDVRRFAGEDESVLYSVEQLTSDDELTGDKDRTAVELQNKVTQYRYIVYKRIGGKQDAVKPTGDLVLSLRDGGGHNRQQGVKWLAIGEHFDRTTALSGVTEADGTLSVQAFDGWSHPEDDNLTYFVKVYFNRPVECNLIDFGDEHVLDLREDMAASDASWGHLIGYETYGDADTYVSQTALEQKDQWRYGQNTIVNTTESLSDRAIAVRKVVKPTGPFLTPEDLMTPFTFTVKEYVNQVYEDAPGIRYTIYNADGTEAGTGTTDALGSFTLYHGQQALLDLPLYSYWKVQETGKGVYRLLVDDNGEIVYDANHNNQLDEEDGLAPDVTAETVYHAQRTDSGFTFHTDLDIVAGVPIGEAVVLRRGIWDNDAKDYSFVQYHVSQDDTSDETGYSTTSDQALYYRNNRLYSSDAFKLDKRSVYGGIIYADMKRCQPIWYDKDDSSIAETVKQAVADYWQGSVTVPAYIYYQDGTDRRHTMYKHRVMGIASRAFSNGDTVYTGLTGITLPASIQKIGSYAFYNCKALTDLSFAPDGTSELLSIGAFAFYKTNVKTFHIPEGVIQLGNGALYAAPTTGYDICLPSTLTEGGYRFLPGIDERSDGSTGCLEINSGLTNADNTLVSRYYDVSNGTSSLFNNDSSYTRPSVLILNHLTKIEREAFTDQGEKMRYTAIMVFPEEENLVVDNQAMVRTNFNMRPFLMIWRSPSVGVGTDIRNHTGAILASTGNWQNQDDIGYYSKLGTTLVFTSISRTDTAKIALIKSRFELEQDENGWYYNANGIHSYIGGTDKRITVLFKEDVQNATADEILTQAQVQQYDKNGRVAEILNGYSTRSFAPYHTAAPVHTAASSNTFLPESLWLLRKRQSSAQGE